MEVNQFNQQEQIQKIGTAEKGDDLEIVDEIGEGWVKIMPSGFKYPEEFSPKSFQVYNQEGENTSYGRTCEFKITNQSNLPFPSLVEKKQIPLIRCR